VAECDSSARSLRTPPGLGACRARVGDEPVVVLHWRTATHDEIAGLSRSELDVLALALAGLPSAAIARRRQRARRTVENQLASVFAKVGVRCRLELFARFAAPARGAA
jgi:DNA-binding CsgD family transcriptional regulator